MYNKVPTDLNFVSREREVARLWKEKDVIHKSSSKTCSPASGP